MPPFGIGDYTKTEGIYPKDKQDIQVSHSFNNDDYKAKYGDKDIFTVAAAGGGYIQ